MPGLKPTELSAENSQVLRAWNMMAGAVDWAALPVIAELVGADDVEVLVRGLLQIRAYQTEGQ